MRTLGIEIKGSETLLVILDGSWKECKVEIPSPSKLPLPTADPDQISKLISLQKQIRDIIRSKKVDHLGVIRADLGCAPLRAKVECVIQFAAKELSIPCSLVATQTIAAAEKRKVNEKAGPDLVQVFQQIKPAYLKKATYCAWSILSVQ